MFDANGAEAAALSGSSLAVITHGGQNALLSLIHLADSALAPVTTILVRGLVLLSVTWVLHAIFERRVSAATRRVWWSVACAALLLVAVTESPLVRGRVPLLIALPFAFASHDSSALQSAPTAVLTDSPTTRPSDHKRITAPGSTRQSVTNNIERGHRAPEAPLPILNVITRNEGSALRLLRASLVLLWAGGVMVAMGRLLRRVLLATRTTQRAHPDLLQSQRMGLPVRRSPDVSTPFVWGWRRSVLVLPYGFDEWPLLAQQAALTHELAHVQARDVMTGLVAQLALAVHWCNPLAHLALRRIERERERAADDAVLASGVPALAYAAALLDAVARARTGGAPPPLAPAHVAQASHHECSSLGERISALLDNTLERAPARVTTQTMSTGLLALSLLLSMIAAQPAQRIDGQARLAVTSSPGWYTPPGVAEPFAPTLFTPDGWTFTPTFTPDLRTAYVVRWDRPDVTVSRRTRQIMFEVQWLDSLAQWGSPVPVQQTAGWRVDWPHVSPDGRRLFLSTTRPHPGQPGWPNAQPFEDFDLWVAERVGQNADGRPYWSAPRPLIGDSLNLPKTLENARRGYVHNETGPRTDRQGRLYFWSEREGTRAAGGGQRDVFVAEPDGHGGYRTPTLLPFNTSRWESGIAVDPDGNWLIFASNGHGGSGGSDLFIVVRQGASWSTPVNLGPTVNSHGDDGAPEVSPDGRTLFFTSNRARRGVPDLDAGDGAHPPWAPFWVDLAAVSPFTRAVRTPTQESR